MGFTPAGGNILLLYHTLTTTVGLIGNTLVLYGSVKYNSLAVDRVSIVLLEWLAAIDLTIVTFFMGSIWLSLLAEGWVTGSVICFISGFVSYVSTPAEMQVVMVISLYRLFTLLAPFRARGVTKGHAKIVVGVILSISVITHFCYHPIGAFYFFETRLGSCEISITTTPTTFTVNYLMAEVFYYIVIPAIVLPASNIAILVIATVKSRRGRLPGRQALVTVSCVTWGFVLSVTPLIVRVGLQMLDPLRVIPEWYLITAQEFLFLNSVFNPVIYTVTNRSLLILIII